MVIVNVEPVEVSDTIDGRVIRLLKEGYSYDDAIIEAKQEQRNDVLTVSLN